MISYLIVCRSLTSAQLTARALVNAGIKADMIRLPHSVTNSGCTFGVKLADARLTSALEVLKAAGRSPEKMFAALENGQYAEVPV